MANLPILVLALLNLLTCSFVRADNDTWRSSTLSTVMVPVLSSNSWISVLETRSSPGASLSRALSTLSPVANNMTAPLSNPSQAPQLQPEETDHSGLFATSKLRSEPFHKPLDPEVAKRICAKHAEAALAEWRKHCKKPLLVVFEPLCWGRAPSVEKCCTKGRKPLGVCTDFLPKVQGGW